MSTLERSCNILVVEDEWLIALDISNLIEEHGHAVVGPARDVTGALKLIGANTIDAAFLDISLGSEKSFPIAERLYSINVPLTFVSAYTEKEIPLNFRDYDLLSKPLTDVLLYRQLLKMLGKGWS